MELYDIERLEDQIYNIKSLIEWARYLFINHRKEEFYHAEAMMSLKEAVENLKIIQEDIEKCKEKKL